jgi:type II secretory pathway component GspD/PulD (secretin)
VADALEVVLSANQLAYEIRGGVLAILTDAEYQAKYGRSFLDLKQTRILTLTYADPARVAQMLGSVKSTAGTVVADPVSGTLIVVDTPDRIAMMSEVVARTDIRTGGRIVPTETRAFQLQYADVQTIVPEIQTMLTKDVGVLKSDNRTRSILVMDLPHVLRRIEDVVRLFDRRPRQVFIEARIVEVTFNDAFSMGVNWSHIFQGINPRFSLETVGTTLGADRAAGDRTLQLNYNTIAAGGDLSLVLEALKTVGKTDILSNPQIAVLDGEEARIEVVEDQPYKEQQFEAGSTNVTGTTYLFKKVGVQLAVTPRINDEDMISIQVRPETSTISTWYDGVEQEGTPVVKQSVAETTVMVRDGVTIIIGGLKDKRVIRSSNVIPVLGQLPLIGRLFRYERSSTRDSEVVVFLTPRIVTGEQPYGIEQDRPKTIKVLKTEDSPSAPDPMPPGVAP